MLLGPVVIPLLVTGVMAAGMVQLIMVAALADIVGTVGIMMQRVAEAQAEAEGQEVGSLVVVVLVVLHLAVAAVLVFMEQALAAQPEAVQTFVLHLQPGMVAEAVPEGLLEVHPLVQRVAVLKIMQV
jgi:predicted permease